MSQVEISKIEIDPNRLRNYSSVPLPDFAVSALQKHGISYDSRGAAHGNIQHYIQQSGGQCKLAQHIQHIQSHINADGARHFNAGSGGNVRNTYNGEHTEGGSSSDSI